MVDREDGKEKKRQQEKANKSKEKGRKEDATGKDHERRKEGGKGTSA